MQEREEPDPPSQALRSHALETARKARAKYGPEVDLAAIEALLADRELVRFPTRLAFDAESLLPGEFAFAQPAEGGPREGFTLCLHPHFRGRDADLPLLVAYHIPTINYLDVATHVEAEVFGAALLGLQVDEYYERVCALADELPGALAGE